MKSVKEIDDQLDLKARFKVAVNLEAIDELVEHLKTTRPFEDENEAIDALYEEITDDLKSYFTVELGEFADHDYIDL